MHSHDRTMLAKFGFADPDKKEPLHDVACRYLATEDVAWKLFNFLGVPLSKIPQEYTEIGETRPGSIGSRKCKCVNRIKTYKHNLELEISKGCGQYRTTVGFLDTALILKGDQEVRWPDSQFFEVRDYIKAIAAEVKIHRVSTGDLLRQINLYRSYFRADFWVAATAYQLSGSEIETLKNEKIFHVYLGDSFRQFVTLQELQPPVENVEI